MGLYIVLLVLLLTSLNSQSTITALRASPSDRGTFDSKEFVSGGKEVVHSKSKAMKAALLFALGIRSRSARVMCRMLSLPFSKISQHL